MKKARWLVYLLMLLLLAGVLPLTALAEEPYGLWVNGKEVTP